MCNGRLLYHDRPEDEPGKVPARGNTDLLQYLFEEIRHVYQIPDEYVTEHKTRKALYDTIKSYLNDTEIKPKEGK